MSYRKLSRRQIFNSLVFPIMCVIWAIWSWVRNWFMGFELFSLQSWGYISAIAVGGIVSAVLTIAVGIETGQYFLPRLLILVSTVGVVGIAGEFIDLDNRLLVLTLIASLIFSAVFFRKGTKLSEWFVIFLSNPVLYYMIWYVLLTIELQSYYDGIF